MAQLVQTAPPFIRLEAHQRLSILAGDAAPPYDPLAGPDSTKMWMKWVSGAGNSWHDRTSGITIP
jgi:hypothetical protein